MKRNPRDHGYGDAPKVAGAPKVSGRVPGGLCPTCGCESVFAIKAEISNPSPMLRRPTEPHRVVGLYIGCPACPWASPMTTTTELLPKEEES